MEPAIYFFFNGDRLETMSRYAEILGGKVGGVVRKPTRRMRKAASPASIIS